MFEKIRCVIFSVIFLSISTVTHAGTTIDSAYALKHTISSITKNNTSLPVDKALSKSALLGVISETDVQLHMYGTFATQADPTRPGRTIRVFDTTTNLNKIARSTLDVLDDKLRSTVQESNPFCGLEGAVIAKIMEALTTGKEGIGNLVKLLKDPAFITTWSDDWDKKVNLPTDDPNQKKKYSLSEFKTKIKDFVKLLEALNKEAKTDTEKEKNINDLTKIFMTFLSVKDQKQKALGKSYAIKNYYSALLNNPFESEYYTTEELEEIGKALLGQNSTHTISKNARGVEDTTAYLAHFVAGDIAFLQAPFATYTSSEKSFAYCAEATVRSIMNSLLYNPETGKLDIAMLPPTMKLNEKFLKFIQKYPDPTAINYYGDSLKDWLELVSGVDGIIYKQGTGKDSFEMSAGAGPKNLVAMLNHILGTEVQSFEELSLASKVKNENGTIIREVSFSPNASGFDVEVTDHGKTIIQAQIGSKEGIGHAHFTLEGKKIIDLLNNEIFRKNISELSDDIAKQNLYGALFKPSTLNVAGDAGEPTPLIRAIKVYGSSILKSMLAFGANPNFKGSYSETPLEVAIFSDDDSLVHELLKNGAHVTEKALLKACISGNLKLVKTVLPLLEQQGTSPNYVDMLLNASMSKSPLPVVEFLLSKGADINAENTLGNTPLINAIQRNELLTIQFFIEKGAHVTEKAIEEACKTGNFELVKILMPLAEKNTTTLDYSKLLLAAGAQSLPLVDFLLEKGADINCKNVRGESLLFTAIYNSTKQEISASNIAKYLIKNGARLTPSDEGTSLLSLAIQKGRADIIELLIKHEAELTPDVLLNIINSKKLTSNEKIQLAKAFLEKNGAVATDVLEIVKKNATETNSDDDDDKLEKKEWAELIPLLTQTYTEQLFGLYITSEQQKCITECITEGV